MVEYIDANTLRKEYNEWYKLFSWSDGTDVEKATIARAIQILDEQNTKDEYEIVKKYCKTRCLAVVDASILLQFPNYQKSIIGIHEDDYCENISDSGFLCNACKFGDFDSFHGYEPKYCPNCGKKIKEKENHE